MRRNLLSWSGSMTAGLLVGMLGGCFNEENWDLRGQPCESNDDCNQGLQCIEELCGGPQEDGGDGDGDGDGDCPEPKDPIDDTGWLPNPCTNDVPECSEAIEPVCSADLTWNERESIEVADRNVPDVELIQTADETILVVSAMGGNFAEAYVYQFVDNALAPGATLELDPAIQVLSSAVVPRCNDPSRSAYVHAGFGESAYVRPLDGSTPAEPLMGTDAGAFAMSSFPLPNGGQALAVSVTGQPQVPIFDWTDGPALSQTVAKAPTESFSISAGRYFDPNEPTLFVVNSSPMGSMDSPGNVGVYQRQDGMFALASPIGGTLMNPTLEAPYGVAPVDLGDDDVMDLVVLERRVNIDDGVGEGTNQNAELRFYSTEQDERSFGFEFERILDFKGGTSITSADFNCDGWPDIVVGYSLEQSVGSEESGALTVIFGPDYENGPEQVIEGEINVAGGDMIVADIDRDGVLDLVVPEWAPGRVRIFSPAL